MNNYLDYIPNNKKNTYLVFVNTFNTFSKQITSKLNDPCLKFSIPERRYLGNVRSDITNLNVKLETKININKQDWPY